MGLESVRKCTLNVKERTKRRALIILNSHFFNWFSSLALSRKNTGTLNHSFCQPLGSIRKSITLLENKFYYTNSLVLSKHQHARTLSLSLDLGWEPSLLEAKAGSDNRVTFILAIYNCFLVFVYTILLSDLYCCLGSNEIR